MCLLALSRAAHKAREVSLERDLAAIGTLPLVVLARRGRQRHLGDIVRRADTQEQDDEAHNELLSEHDTPPDVGCCPKRASKKRGRGLQARCLQDIVPITKDIGERHEVHVLALRAIG